MKIRDEIADFGSGSESTDAQRNFKLPDLAGITAFHAEIDTAFAKRAACFDEENSDTAPVRSARMALALSLSNDDDVMKEVRLNSVDISERTAPAALSTRRRREYDGSATKTTGNRNRIDTGSAAPADDDRVGRIDAPA